jgi:acyl-CoA thioester hydrolase
MSEPREHVHHVRVRYAETDQMGVAHHASYVSWIEEGRTEWMRAHGRSYRSIEAEGLSLAVTRLALRYLKPARYDDVVRIFTWLAQAHMASLMVGYRLHLAPEGADGPTGERIADAETRLALLDRAGRPMRIPPVLLPPPAT